MHGKNSLPAIPILIYINTHWRLLRLPKGSSVPMLRLQRISVLLGGQSELSFIREGHLLCGGAERRRSVGAYQQESKAVCSFCSAFFLLG